MALAPPCFALIDRAVPSARRPALTGDALDVVGEGAATAAGLCAPLSFLPSQLAATGARLSSSFTPIDVGEEALRNGDESLPSFPFGERRLAARKSGYETMDTDNSVRSDPHQMHRVLDFKYRRNGR